MHNETLNHDNAIWDDGEWISWDEINQQIQYKEWRAKYPKADISLVPVFERLLGLAEDYFQATDNHLHVYGDLGELYAAITIGIKLHRNYAQGSDGRLKDDFYEVKTIAPFNQTDITSVKMSGNFNKLFIVKINENFEFASKLIERTKLPKKTEGVCRIKWSDY